MSATNPAGAWQDGKYTVKQYRRWLEAVLEQLQICLDEGKWPKGVREYDYLDCADVTYSPWFVIDPSAQELISRQEGRDVPRVADYSIPTGQMPTSSPVYRSAEYELDYRSGNSAAIFAWASVPANGESLRAPWVIEQLIEWRRDGSPDARQRFDRFMREYWNPIGVRKPETVFATIERDQAILFAYLDQRGDKPEEQLYEELGKQAVPVVGSETVRKVIAHYRAHFDVWKNGDLGPFPMPPR
jgi:hypothetical protein